MKPSFKVVMLSEHGALLRSRRLPGARAAVTIIRAETVAQESSGALASELWEHAQDAQWAQCPEPWEQTEQPQIYKNTH